MVIRTKALSIEMSAQVSESSNGPMDLFTWARCRMEKCTEKACSSHLMATNMMDNLKMDINTEEEGLTSNNLTGRMT